jgi:hypothetical protein
MREGHRERISRAQTRAAAPEAVASPSPIVRAPDNPLPWSAVMGARALFPLRLSGLQGAAALPGVAAPTLFAPGQDRELRLAARRSCGAIHPIAFGGGNFRLSRTAKSGCRESRYGHAAAIDGAGVADLHPSRFSSGPRASRSCGRRSSDLQTSKQTVATGRSIRGAKLRSGQCSRGFAEKTWRENDIEGGRR